MKPLHSYVGKLEKYEDKLYNYHIKIPSKIIRDFKKKGIKRFICRLNDEISIHASAISAGDGDHYMMINKDLRKKLRLSIGTQVDIQLLEDDSKYGIPLPAEMEELMLLDYEGSNYFHDLTPGKQRSLLHLVDKIKHPQLRIEKSIIILEHLKEQRGKLDFKILTQDFRDKKGTV